MAPRPQKKRCTAFGGITPAKRKDSNDARIAKVRHTEGGCYGAWGTTPPLKLTRTNLALLNYLNGDLGKKKKDNTHFGSTSTAMDKTKPGYNNDPQYDANVRPVIRPIPPDQDFAHVWFDARLDAPEILETPVSPSHLGSHCLYDHKHSLSFCHLAVYFKRTKSGFNRAVRQRGYHNAALANTRKWVLAQARAKVGWHHYRH